MRSPASMTSVGPITVRISEPRAGSEGQLGVSGIYRNKASAEALPETYNGCATLYELFNKAVEEHGDNRCIGRRGLLLLPLLPRLLRKPALKKRAAPAACRCLGWRPIAEDGSAGPYEFITYKETQGGILFVPVNRPAAQERCP